MKKSIGGGSGLRLHRKQRRRRKSSTFLKQPSSITSSCTLLLLLLLLLASSSSSSIVSASNHDNNNNKKNGGKPTKTNNNLRRHNSHHRHKQRTLLTTTRSSFCPPNYSGRAPTTNCEGYVDCISGKEGIHIKCLDRQKFSVMVSQCAYNVDTCQMLVQQDDDATTNTNNDNDNIHLNTLDKYCPMDYTGRAPISNCEGYVDCDNGIAKRSKSCTEDGTQFDIMTLSCKSGLSADDCDVVLQINNPTVSPITKEVLSYNLYSCPHELTGYKVLPGCKDYIYCYNGIEQGRHTCPEGTLYDGTYCSWADTVSCLITALPTSLPSFQPTWLPTNNPSQHYTPPTVLDLQDSNIAIYYPNFMNGVCLNDDQYPPNDVNIKQYLFTSSDKCCSTYFSNNMERCLDATKPTPSPTPTYHGEYGTKIWFVDWTQGTCTTDQTKQSPHESNFFATFTNCCSFTLIPNKQHCLQSKPNLYYPDYWNNKCISDGKEIELYETNVFDSYVECCYFDWLDTNVCLESGPTSATTNNIVDDIRNQDLVGVDFYPDL